MSAFTLLIYSSGPDTAMAIEWTSDHIQYQFDKHGCFVDGWSHDYSVPEQAGLWLASGTVVDDEPTAVEWRRLTPSEAVARAAGEWPMPEGSAT